MAKKDMYHNIRVQKFRSKIPVDLKGYESHTFAVFVPEEGSISVKVEESDDKVTYKDVTHSMIIGETSKKSDTLLQIGYKGVCRYLRVTVNATSPALFHIAASPIQAPIMELGSAVEAPEYTGEVQVDEEGLSGGSNAGSESETVVWNPPAGFTVYSVSNGKKGTTKISGNSVSYTLTNPIMHEPGSGENISKNADSFVATIGDADDNIFDVIVKVDVKDDIPSISSDGDKSVQAGKSVTGNVSIVYGADNAGGSKKVTVNGDAGSSSGGDNLSFTLENGTLSLNQANGSYKFTSTGDAAASQQLTFSVTDADGDSVTTMVTITITDPEPEPEPEP